MLLAFSYIYIDINLPVMIIYSPYLFKIGTISNMLESLE